MTFFTKWNFVLVSLFVTGACFLIWLSRWARGSYSDGARLGGILLSMLVDHTTPPRPVSSNTLQTKQFFQKSNPQSPLLIPRPKRHRFTSKQRHYIASLQDYSCYLCGDRLCNDLKDMDIDHILALERGGKDWPDLTNLCALCVACHRRKTILERQRTK
jgi:hypothetical protein